MGVLGSLCTPGDPAVLGWARSGREGNAPAVRTHWSLPSWAPRPAAQQALRGTLAPLGSAVEDDGHPKPHTSLLAAPRVPGPAPRSSVGALSLRFSRCPGKALHSAHEQAGARRGHCVSSMVRPQKLERADLGFHPGGPSRAPTCGSAAGIWRDPQTFCKPKSEGMSVAPPQICPVPWGPELSGE